MVQQVLHTCCQLLVAMTLAKHVTIGSGCPSTQNSEHVAPPCPSFRSKHPLGEPLRAAQWQPPQTPILCCKLLARSSQPCSSVSSLNLTLLPPHPEALESTAVPPLVSRWCNCPIHTQDLRMARKAGGSGRPPADRPKDSVCGKAHLHVPN